jgi:fasciclin 1
LIASIVGAHAFVIDFYESFFISVTVAKRIEDVGSSANTDLDGNPPIYVTKVDEDYYVNNALVLKSKSNYVANNEAGKRQVRMSD